MRTRASRRRPRSGVGLAVDEGELSRFRAWLVGRGYAEPTAKLWTNRVRSAYGSGIVSPDEVNAVLGALHRDSRTNLRAALRAWMEFRGPA